MTKETMSLLQSLGENEKAAFFEYIRKTGTLEIIADLLAVEYHEFNQSKQKEIYHA
jgi:hypothetical protein